MNSDDKREMVKHAFQLLWDLCASEAQGNIAGNHPVLQLWEANGYEKYGSAAIHGPPPLAMVAMTGQTDLVREIIDKYSDSVKQENTDGETSLFYTVDPVMIRMLVDSGCAIDKRNKKGQTALFVQCLLPWSRSRQDFVEIMVGLGLDINARDKDGYTALAWALRHGASMDVILALIDASADARLNPTDGTTVLMWGATIGREVCELLYDEGCLWAPQRKDWAKAREFCMERIKDDVLRARAMESMRME